MERNLMRAFGRAAVLAVAVGVSVPVSAAEIMISWHFENGETAIENRQMVEKDGVAVFTLGKDEITSRRADSVELTPDFARAKKGDEGFWVVSSGETGTFRCDDGVLDCQRWQVYNVHPTLGMDPDDIESIRRHEKEDWGNVDLFR